VPQQIQGLISKPLEEFPLYQPFTKFPSTFSEADHANLRTRGANILKEDVLPAFARFATFFKNEYAPKAKKEISASKRYPDGEKFYAFRIQRFTTTNLSAREIHDLGLKEVARIKQRMLEIIQAAKFQGGFKEFVEFLRTGAIPLDILEHRVEAWIAEMKRS
jgi:uncharacterized protein (DUF885 family)